MPTKTLHFVGLAGPYAPGDVAAFDDLARANGFILSGAPIDAAWDTAGPNGTPLKGAFMAGRSPGVQAWSYQGPPLDMPLPASFISV